MTQDNKNGHAGYHNDPEEIDLIDLIMQLWRGKGTIVICVAIAIVLASAYLFMAKEKWTSTAIITQPDVGQISDYANALNILYGDDASQGSDQPSSPSASGPSAHESQISDVQKQLVDRFNTAFSAFIESPTALAVPGTLSIEQMVKNQALPLRVSFTGQSAEKAQQMLTDAVQQIDAQVVQSVEADLKTDILIRERALKSSLATQEKFAEEQKAQRMAQIKHALTVALEANIKLPQVQQIAPVSQDTLFMLGSNALSSMVQNEATRPLSFPDSYYHARLNLLNVASLLPAGEDAIPKIENLHSYSYVMQPTLPGSRNSPKRALVLVLAVLLGGMIGAGVVLGRNALRNYQSKG